MIAAVDVETQGLNAQKFIIGCLILNGQKPEFYYNKKDLWTRILTVAKQQKKHNNKLTIYSHNAQYDFYAYTPSTQQGFKYHSINPFIVEYQEKGQTLITFLDSMNIYTMSLKKLGEIINLPKLEQPQELQQDKPQKINIKTLIEYNQRDTEIVLQSINKIRNKIKQDGIQIKRLYTLNQIAINYMLKKLKNTLKEPETIFYNKEKNQLHKTKNTKYIHAAYKGGRVTAFQTGQYENCTLIDKQSLYAQAATQIQMPILTTETHIINPLQNYSQEFLLGKPGVITCMITNNNDTIGSLPITTTNGNWYLQPEQTAIGTWTTTDIQTAIQNNHTIHKITNAIIYEENQQNPFTQIMQQLYEERKKSKTTFDDYIYKGIMNRAIGKFGQHRTNQEYTIDSPSKAEEYLKKNYQIIMGIGDNYLYKTEPTQTFQKKYYAPIIPALVTAKARQIMNKDYRKIPREDLLYTDTDSILYKNEHTNKYTIGSELGDYKIEQQNQKATIIANKIYIIGEKIKAAGITNPTKEQIEKGTLTIKRMKTIKTTKNAEELGTFYEQTQQIEQIHKNYQQTQAIMKNTKIILDETIIQHPKTLLKYTNEIQKMQM